MAVGDSASMSESKGKVLGGWVCEFVGERTSDSMIVWSAARMFLWTFWNPSTKDHHVCWPGRCHWGCSGGATESDTARRMTVICRHFFATFLTKHSLLRSLANWQTYTNMTLQHVTTCWNLHLLDPNYFAFWVLMVLWGVSSSSASLPLAAEHTRCVQQDFPELTRDVLHFVRDAQ